MKHLALKSSSADGTPDCGDAEPERGARFASREPADAAGAGSRTNFIFTNLLRKGNGEVSREFRKSHRSSQARIRNFCRCIPQSKRENPTSAPTSRSPAMSCVKNLPRSKGEYDRILPLADPPRKSYQPGGSGIGYSCRTSNRLATRCLLCEGGRVRLISLRMDFSQFCNSLGTTNFSDEAALRTSSNRPILQAISTDRPPFRNGGDERARTVNEAVDKPPY